jgi:hypothetical protein
MLAAQFIRRFALFSMLPAALSFQSAQAQTGTRKAPEVETPASQPAPAAPATSTPPAHQRIHPAGRRPGPGNAPKDAQKSAS